MKLIRFGPVGQEKPGIELDNGTRVDVSTAIPDFHEAFFSEDPMAKVGSLSLDVFPQLAHDVRLGPPLSRPSKIVCVGLNYAAHAQESGAQPPKQPIIFFKATTAICGPFDDVILPLNSTETDWEVELAVVIGKKATYVSQEEAMEYVFGYLVHNDYSERAYQLKHGGQWVKGKSADTFAPLGPWLVTKDEISDPHQLHLWLKVNGEIFQDSSTSDFIFDIPYLIHYISQYMTLLPGDIISTGTPSGVGLGFSPPRYLTPGDVVELGIEGLGTSRQAVKAYPMD